MSNTVFTDPDLSDQESFYSFSILRPRFFFFFFFSFLALIWFSSETIVVQIKFEFKAIESQ